MAKPGGSSNGDLARPGLRHPVQSEQFAEVSFAVKVGDGKFQPTGTDDNAPYRVFHDAGDLEPGTPLTIRTVVNDLNGHLRSAAMETVLGG